MKVRVTEAAPAGLGLASVGDACVSGRSDFFFLCMAFIQFDPGVNVAPIAINETEAKKDSNNMIVPWGRGLGQKQNMGEKIL